MAYGTPVSRYADGSPLSSTTKSSGAMTVPAGNLILVAASAHALTPPTTMGVTDTQTLTWVPASTLLATASGIAGGVSRVWVAVSNGAETTITVEVDNSSIRWAMAVASFPADAAVSLVQDDENSGDVAVDGQPTVTLGSTPSGPVVSVCFNAGGQAATPGTDFTELLDVQTSEGNDCGIQIQYDLAGNTDGVADVSGLSGTQWDIVVLELAEASGGESDSITEDATLDATFDALVARLGALTEGAEFGVTIDAALSADQAFGVSVDAQFDEALARLGALDEGAALGATFQGDTVAVGALTEDAQLAATFDALLARLAAITEDAEFGLSLGTAVTTFFDDFAAVFGSDFAPLTAYAQAWGGDASMGSSFDGVLTDTERTIQAAAAFGLSVGAAVARAGALAGDVALGDDYVGSASRVGALSGAAAVGGSFDAALAMLSSLSEGVGLGATFSYGLTLVPTLDRIAIARGPGFFTYSRRGDH